MLLILLFAAAPVSPPGPPLTARASYDPDEPEQFQSNKLLDLKSASKNDREVWARLRALDASATGSLPATPYRQIDAQTGDHSDPDYTGFSRFRHDRRAAYPGYKDARR